MTVQSALGILLLLAPGALAQAPDRASQGRAPQGHLEHRLLATARTSTMEKELNEAGAEGFRLVSAMGGTTSFGGDELVAVVARPVGDQNRAFSYRVLAANKTSTILKELNRAADDGYVYRDQSIADTLGDREIVLFVERPVTQVGPAAEEYHLLAANRTKTLSKEIEQAQEDGYAVIGLTVASTMFGGNEGVVLLARPRSAAAARSARSR